MPLTGVKVLDLTRVLSGPFCTALLGDMGADVIKVEAPEGDSVRGQGAIKHGLSWYFAQFNRNKRSIRLDLRKPEAKAILARLIETSDVLVENFRPGVMARLGFPESRLKELRPSLVLCSINGFWQYRSLQGSTVVRLHRSGHEWIHERQRWSDDPPLRSGLADQRSGGWAVCRPVHCRRRAERPGEGAGAAGRGQPHQRARQFSVLHRDQLLRTGTAPPRSGNDHPIAAPYGLFPTRDGQIAIAPADDAFFRRLADALGEPGLKSDPLYATQAARVANRARSTPIVGGKLAGDTTACWVDVLNKAGVPCGPVNSVAEVFEDPQILAQEMVMDVDQPGHGIVRLLGFPIKFSIRLVACAALPRVSASIRMRSWRNSAMLRRTGWVAAGRGYLTTTGLPI